MTTISRQQNISIAQPPVTDRMANHVQHRVAIVQQQPYSDITATDDPRHKHKKTLRGLGITECVIGGISVLLAAIANTIVSSEHDSEQGQDLRISFIGFTYVSTGIWCGIFVIVTGILGIRVMNTPSICIYVTNMTMALITAVIASGGTGISITAAVFSWNSVTMVILHYLIAILCFVAMILTIIHSAFCCGGSCYEDSSVSAPQRMAQPRQIRMQPQPQYAQDLDVQPLLVVDQRIIPQTIPLAPTTLRQITTNARPVVVQVPYTSAEQSQGAYENVCGTPPPAYFP